MLTDRLFSSDLDQSEQIHSVAGHPLGQILKGKLLAVGLHSPLGGHNIIFVDTKLDLANSSLARVVKVRRTS